MPEDNGVESIFLEIDQKVAALRGYLTSMEIIRDFIGRVDVSWIYHDFALEGTVLSYPELNAAIDDEIISDTTLIPSYEEVQNHKSGIAYVRSNAGKRKVAYDVDYLKQLHQILCTETCPRPGKAPPRPPGGQYRKDMPLHRQYFHEISPPDKIAYQVRKFVQSLTEDDARKMHPVKRAAFAHHRLISIYPWPQHSGKIARLMMNALLLRDDYPPAVIHAIDRQRYYEVLRQPPAMLAELVAESLNSTLSSALRHFGHELGVEAAA